MTTKRIRIGDRIVFKSTTRWSCAKATRVVNGLTADEWPTVRYGGWADFIVRPREIIDVIRRED